MNRAGDWTCRSCRYLNFSWRESCQRCSEAKPGESRDLVSLSGRAGASFAFSSPEVRPGDWFCSAGNCGAHNFASRSSCFKCGAFKDESARSFDGDVPRSRGSGSGSGSGSGRSGWKSGDWICTRPGCNEHNFASRMECYRCNSPRDSRNQS
ncbi:RNA-binding protein involved in heterochromatin assembly dri1-like [Tasmannia lanceolata]|uniref:RNA-binding protein involved in heterochromatin assembly dri1-like n=1 Tax=Tasmannia lanceolata TaxID=3420 RepID=UPI004063BBC6